MKTPNDNSKLFFLILLSLFALLFVFNVKSYIFVVLLFGLIYFLFLGEDVVETVFILLLFSLPFEKGLREWVIQVVAPGPEIWAPGYSFYFGFSLKLIFVITLFFMILSDKKYRLRKIVYDNKLILSFFALSLLSVFFAPVKSLVIPGLIRIASTVWLFIAARELFKERNIRDYFEKLIISFLIFFGFIGTIQFLTKQPLGLFLEDVSAIAPFGFFTTEGGDLYRVSGLTGHPTFFASFLSLLFPVGVGSLLFYIKKRNFKSIYFILAVVGIFLGLVSIIGTFSRSSWVALVVTIMLFGWRVYKKKRTIISKSILSLVIPILITILVLSPLIFSRLSSFKYIWSLGSGRIRLDLIEQAWLMIKNFPFFGVGLNHFTWIMSMKDLPPEIKGFMFPVHNTFLLFFSELGVMAGFVFLTFILMNLYRPFSKSLKSWLNFGFWIGAATFLINAQFHTLFSQDPTLELFIVYLAFLNAV